MGSTSPPRCATRTSPGWSRRSTTSTPAASTAAPLDLRDLREPVVELETRAGELKLVPEPAGTRGYDDLRRRADREPLGRGLRPQVASTDDLARMLGALDREQDSNASSASAASSNLERKLPPPAAASSAEAQSALLAYSELVGAIVSETQMHQGAETRHGLCTLYECRAADSAAGPRSSSDTRRSDHRPRGDSGRPPCLYPHSGRAGARRRRSTRPARAPSRRDGGNAVGRASDPGR